jgi:hypothetical protein
VHEAAVDLDEVRVQRGDAPEARVPRAGVVDGDERTAARSPASTVASASRSVSVCSVISMISESSRSAVPNASCTSWLSIAVGLTLTDMNRLPATCGRASRTWRTMSASMAPP